MTIDSDWLTEVFMLRVVRLLREEVSNEGCEHSMWTIPDASGGPAVKKAKSPGGERWMAWEWQWPLLSRSEVAKCQFRELTKCDNQGQWTDLQHVCPSLEAAAGVVALQAIRTQKHAQIWMRLLGEPVCFQHCPRLQGGGLFLESETWWWELF